MIVPKLFSYALKFSERWLITGVLFWVSLSIFGVLFYVLFGVSLGMALISFVCALGVTGIFFRLYGVSDYIEISFYSGWYSGSAVVCILLDIILFILLMRMRVDMPLQTPWIDYGIWLFIIYACSTALLFISARKESVMFWIAYVFHSALTYGVLVIVFQSGFGYDPLIHQATEKYMLEYGKIQPFQPLYLGQYVLVVITHLLTKIPFDLIDRLLVPVLAIISIPFVAMIGLKKAYKIPQHIIPYALCFLFLIPFSELTFTVPYHVSFLYALWFIFLFPLLKEKWYLGILGVLVLAALVTHPLSGVPLLLLYVLGILFIRNKKNSPLFFGMSFLAVSVSVPMLFGIYRMRSGFPFFDPIPLQEGLRFFISLFIPPYLFDQTPFVWMLFYFGVCVIKVAVLGFGLYCVWKYKESWVKRSLIVFLAGLLGIIFLLALFVRIPGIRLNEQAEYMLRLRDSFFVFLAPFLIIQLLKVLKKYRLFELRNSPRILVIVLISGISAMMWYVAYPTINLVSHTAGWNVTSSDIATVQAIERGSVGKKYVVLTDPLFAITALRERGFEKNLTSTRFGNLYPYPISADHYLNQYWYKLLVGAFSSSDILRIKYDLGVDQVYVAVHSYQTGRAGIERSLDASGAKQIAQFPFLSLYTFE